MTYDDLLLSTVQIYARPMMKRAMEALGVDSSSVDEMSDEEVSACAQRYADLLSKTCHECGRPYDEEVT